MNKSSITKIAKTTKLIGVSAFAALLLSGSAAGQGRVEKWDCGADGANVTATLKGRTLTISGKGAMYNYSPDGMPIISPPIISPNDSTPPSKSDELNNIMRHRSPRPPIEAPWSKYRTSITDVIIEEGVTTIGSYSFINHTDLKSVTIPRGVDIIGKEAFHNCVNLTSVTLPEGMTTLGDHAFRRTGLKSVTIPKSMKVIGHCAFYRCDNLTTITLPAGVTIGGEVFAGCASLTSIHVETGSVSHSSVDGVLFDKAGKILMQYPPGRKGTYAIPDGVKVLAYNSFNASVGLTSVTIPNSVDSLARGVFAHCTGLETVVIGKGVAVIGTYAFYDCNRLTSVTSLNPVPPRMPTRQEPFELVRKANVTLYVPKGSAKVYRAADVWKDFANIVELDAR